MLPQLRRGRVTGGPLLAILRHARSSVALLLLASVTCAQSAPHPTTIPKAATGAYAWARTPSPFVFGRTGGRVQYWYRGDNIPNPPIVLAIGPRASPNARSTARSQSVEITMSNTTVDFFTMSSTFTANFGTGTTVVFARRDVSLPAVSFQQGPDSPVLWIMLDVPFLFSGPHFVVQFDLGPASGSMAAMPDGDTLFGEAAGAHMVSEKSCAEGRLLSLSSTASTYVLNLLYAPPVRPVSFLVSANATWTGGLLLPVKLDGIGMTGCVLGVDPMVIVPGTTDAAGSATLSLPYSASRDSLVVYAQVVHPTTTNAAGLATTAVMRAVLGPMGYCNYIYNFSIDGPVAQHGPLAYNAATCLLLKP